MAWALFPSNYLPPHNPPARSYNTHRAIASMTTCDTIEGDLSYRMRIDTWPIMLTPYSRGIVSAGICTVEWFHVCRPVYWEGIIYRGDIWRFIHNTIDHLLTCIKQLGLSARYFSLIFSQIKLQYKNNATHHLVLFKYKTKDPQERA